MKLLFNRVDKKMAKLLQNIFSFISKDINIPIQFSRLYGISDRQTVFISYDEENNNEELSYLNLIKQYEADIIYASDLDTAITSIDFAKSQSTFYVICNTDHFPFFYSILSDRVIARKNDSYNILNQIVVGRDITDNFLKSKTEKILLLLLLSCEELGLTTYSMKCAIEKYANINMLNNCEKVIELIKYL